MTESTERFDRDLAAWLDEGVGRAPVPLIESIVEETRRNAQRPALVAVALGAPTLRDQRRVGGLRLEGVVVLALVALAALAAVLLAGSPRDWFDRLAVAPSAAAPTDPGPTAGPTPEATANPAPTPQSYVGDVYTVTATTVADRWTDVSGPFAGTGGQTSVLFRFGSCAPDAVLCVTPTVSVVTGPTRAPIGVGTDASGAQASVTGSTVDELAASWIATFGTSNVEKHDVSGWPAVVLTHEDQANTLLDGRRSAAFVVTDRETIALTSGGLVPSRARLVAMLAGLMVRHAPTLEYVDYRSGLRIRPLVRPWTHSLPGMLGAGPAPNADPSSVAFWYGDCADNLCPGGYVTVSSGTYQKGAVVEVRGSATGDGVIRVAGQSLEDVKASWLASFGATTFGAVTVDGRAGAIARSSGQTTALFVTARGIVAIVARPPFFGSGSTDSLLEDFLAGIEFLPVGTSEYRNESLGFAVDSASFSERWSGISGPNRAGASVESVSFEYGANAMVVESGPIGSPFAIGASHLFDPIYAGGDVDALATAWMKLYSPARVDTIDISGWSARLVTSTRDGFATSAVFVATDARAYYIAGSGSAGLRAFLQGFRLLDTP